MVTSSDSVPVTQEQNILTGLIAHCGAEVAMWGFAEETVTCELECLKMSNPLLPVCLSICLSYVPLLQTSSTPFSLSHCNYQCSN